MDLSFQAMHPATRPLNFEQFIPALQLKFIFKKFILLKSYPNILYFYLPLLFLVVAAAVCVQAWTYLCHGLCVEMSGQLWGWVLSTLFLRQGLWGGLTEMPPPPRCLGI